MEKYCQYLPIQDEDEYENDDNPSYEHFLVYHARDGFLNPPILPNNYYYDYQHDTIAFTDERAWDCGRKYYYDENDKSWGILHEDENEGEDEFDPTSIFGDD